MAIPGEDDWRGIHVGPLEAQDIVDSFCGKSFQEAVAMCEADAMSYAGNLLFMPAAPFNFYAPALASYVASERAHDDCDGASSFLSMVEYMLSYRREIVARETMELLMNAAAVVAGRQEYYDADREIYGSFRGRHERLLALVDNAV